MLDLHRPRGLEERTSRQFACPFEAGRQHHFAARLSLCGTPLPKDKGVPQNEGEAAKWFRLAAEQGNATAQVALGLMYHEGRGVPQNDKETVKWYRLGNP